MKKNLIIAAGAVLMAVVMMLISCNSGRGDELPKKVTDYIEGKVLHCDDLVGQFHTKVPDIGSVQCDVCIGG